MTARRAGGKLAKIMLQDKFGREIHDLRISVTDRCNFSCVYCKSADPKNYFPHRDLPTWDEFLRVARVLAGQGIRKVRVTGGEPLLRDGIVNFIGDLHRIRGLTDIAITTKGYLLPEMAAVLAATGPVRVTVSLDSTDPAKFARITRTPRSCEKVMAGVEAALAAGLKPVKVNIVLVRGFNDDEIVEFARLARRQDLIVRFIEFMPLDADHAWSRGVVITAKEIVETVNAVFPLVEIPRRSPSETALRYQFADGQGELGIIAPVSIPFCGQCSRLRLTADGKIRTCLFSLREHDVRHLVRNGATDDDLAQFFTRVVHQKEPGHRINEPDFVQPKRTMVYIGG
ncbi:MAG: GTP 3',8-cyclase MoaA [Acidobacteriia bacterium]|nr:GTP 3',8-cyclase MoaA [Terriglobia bacterium]